MALLRGRPAAAAVDGKEEATTGSNNNTSSLKVGQVATTDTPKERDARK